MQPVSVYIVSKSFHRNTGVYAEVPWTGLQKEQRKAGSPQRTERVYPESARVREGNIRAGTTGS